VRRVARLLVALGIVAVAVFASAFVLVLVVSQQDERRPVDAIIVLGAAQYNGRPSPVLEARLAHALQLYRRGLAPVIVVTGGRQPGDRYTEATTGYDYLRAHGVPDAAIRKEVQGGSTWESLQAAARFLHDERIDRVILVSDSYHSLRLLEIAGEVGLHGRVSPSGEHLSSGTELRYELRETVAVSIGRVTGFHLLDRR